MEVGGWVSPAAAAAAAAAAADPRAAAVNADSGVGGKPILHWLLKLGKCPNPPAAAAAAETACCMAAKLPGGGPKGKEMSLELNIAGKLDKCFKLNPHWHGL